MVHHFTQGSGYVMKRNVFANCGPIRASESFTSYCLRAANRGWINGWYFPFIHEEHMDDPSSPFYPYRTDDEFRAHIPLTARKLGLASLAEWRQLNRHYARRVQEEIIDPRAHAGWRSILRKIKRRVSALQQSFA